MGGRVTQAAAEGGPNQVRLSPVCFRMWEDIERAKRGGQLLLSEASGTLAVWIWNATTHCCWSGVAGNRPGSCQYCCDGRRQRQRPWLAWLFSWLTLGQPYISAKFGSISLWPSASPGIPVHSLGVVAFQSCEWLWSNLRFSGAILNFGGVVLVEQSSNHGHHGLTHTFSLGTSSLVDCLTCTVEIQGS